MSKVTSDTRSEIPGGYRDTITYGDGTSRDIDHTRSEGERHVTVTDHDANGNSKSGEGASDSFSRGGYSRHPSK